MKLHYPEGMKLHGENACKYHGFEKYDWKTDREKPAVFWLYTEDDYKYLSAHQGKKIVIWNGSDVQWFTQVFAGRYVNVIRDPNVMHVCLNEMLESELAHNGIYSITRYLFYGDTNKYTKQSPLTKDAYISVAPGKDDKGRTREVEYGGFLLNALAGQFKDWNFHIFGVDPMIQTYYDNVKYYGWIPEDEMDEITNNFKLCLRLNTHDGFPQTICKALYRGHEIISRLPYRGLTRVSWSYPEIIANINNIDNEIETIETKPDFTKMINNFDFLTI